MKFCYLEETGVHIRGELIEVNLLIILEDNFGSHTIVGYIPKMLVLLNTSAVTVRNSEKICYWHIKTIDNLIILIKIILKHVLYLFKAENKSPIILVSNNWIQFRIVFIIIYIIQDSE